MWLSRTERMEGTYESGEESTAAELVAKAGRDNPEGG